MIISSDRSRVRVFVIHTNEEAMIARHTVGLMASAQATSAVRKPSDRESRMIDSLAP